MTKSHINGTGYGASHAWQDRGTPYSGCTNYKCAACGALFSHYYHGVSNIFDAIKNSAIPDKCPKGEA